MAAGTNVCAVAPDTDSLGMSHIVVYTKATLAEQARPAALALTDVSKSVSAVTFGALDLDVNHVGGDALMDVSTSVSAVSFGDLDLGANRVGGDVSWTPPEIDAGIETYESYLATDAASSGGALAGSMAVSVTPSRSGHRARSSAMSVTSQLASHAGLSAPSRASSRVPASPLGRTSNILQK